MSGFGGQPFGSSPYGVGTPAVAAPLGGVVLRDPNTGQSTGSRYIDPFAKDYVLDTNGRILGMGNTQQLVLMAVSTRKGSSAMQTLGQELSAIDRVTGNFARRVDATLRAAVQPIVDRGLIVVLGITVDVIAPGIARAVMRWRDLASGNDQVTFIEPQHRGF